MSIQFDSVNKFFLDRHINLKPEWLHSCLKFLQKHNKKVEHLNNYAYDQWLHTDIKESTKPSFQPPVGRLFSSYAVLQVEAVLNISKSYYTQMREIEHNENHDLDVGAEPDDKNNSAYWEQKQQRRMLKFVFSDGVKTVKAIEHLSNPLISSSLQPGAKVIVTRCQYRDPIMLLTPRNCQFLGGYVPKLVEKNCAKALINQMPFMQNRSTNITVPQTKPLPLTALDRKRKLDSGTNGTTTYNGTNNVNGTTIGINHLNNAPSTSGLGNRPAFGANGTSTTTNGTTNSMSTRSNTSTMNNSTNVAVNRPTTRPGPVVTINKPSTSSTVNNLNATNGPVCLSAQLNAKNNANQPSTSGFKPPETQKRPQISVTINRRPSSVNRPTTSTAPAPQAAAEPVCISMQLNNKTRKCATTVPPAITPNPPSTTISVPLNNTRRINALNRQSDVRPDPKDMLKTPHGTNLSMDNFAVPKSEVKKPAITITPQKPYEPKGILKTTPLSINSKANTPTSANSTRSSLMADSKEFAYSCEHCNISFKDRVLYQMHSGYHGFKEPLTCNRCGFEAATSVDFYSHLYGH
ncbi:unnamed protein product [Bursaphelenchus okinawaensis]|uniref:RecQ-mediated genome instability protein 1 n=1 Tax=Bursaphelenchus okinawaensis TaxID=465554 RepID=A0A811L2M6_9BILA|nr:unnamed protein product [Bursaphelenchus okinawaensis]CAG9117581.1 unnamed protein product [Bursaphelenchus okinawaensis]